jgi:hypothetical protein
MVADAMRPILQTVWATDFDALRLKLISIGQFATFVVTAFSAAANLLPKYENAARPKLLWISKQTRRVVAFGALNWRKHVEGVAAMPRCPKEKVSNDDRA